MSFHIYSGNADFSIWDGDLIKWEIVICKFVWDVSHIPAPEYKLNISLENLKEKVSLAYELFSITQNKNSVTILK